MNSKDNKKDIKANLIIVLEEHEDWIEGWMFLGDNLEEFKYHLEEEIEYNWGLDYADLDDYVLFFIDIEDKNNLKEIKSEEMYQRLKQRDDIYIVVLEKTIKYRFIENLPCVFEWFSDYHGVNPFYL